MAGYGYGGPYGSGGGYPSPAQPYGNPFAALTPLSFPPGTDPSLVACFQMADQDGSGLVDDRELQRALSSYNQSFSLRTVRLLMYLFTHTNTRRIGPREFIGLFHCLQMWRGTFERFDSDRSGKIDGPELREALLSMGFVVPPVVVDLLVTKYDKYGDGSRAIEYDNFIECCLIVKGLTEKFKERDTMLHLRGLYAHRPAFPHCIETKGVWSFGSSTSNSSPLLARSFHLDVLGTMVYD